MKNILITVLILISIGASVYVVCSRPKTAYVNINELYNEFVYKKELEEKLANVQNLRNAILDSIKVNYEVLNNRILKEGSDEESIKQLKFLQGEYSKKKKVFEENNQALIEEYNQQIVSQLNQYVKDYAEKNNYDYLYGAKGDGSIMYAAPDKNITEEVLLDINNRYQGL